MYYWVNQGKTYKEEKEGGYLWAPTKNSDGRSFFYWENMTDLKPGDIVYNYRKGFLVGYCIIISETYKNPQPEEFNVDTEWENDGYMADADYYLFDTPISKDEIYNRIFDVLPSKYTPIYAVQKDSGLKIGANQGYLYKLTKEIGERIGELANIKNQFTSNEDRFVDQSDFKTPDKTSRRGLVTSRVGQGEYRQRILRRWKNKCAVTGSGVKEILIASHIVPWRDSNNQERLDVDNGILLSPVFDALFDRHLISFGDDGKIIISSSVKLSDLKNLGILGNEYITGLTDGNKKYLQRHRKKLMDL